MHKCRSRYENPKTWLRYQTNYLYDQVLTAVRQEVNKLVSSAVVHALDLAIKRTLYVFL